jgi:hypothetical protein
LQENKKAENYQSSHVYSVQMQQPYYSSLQFGLPNLLNRLNKTGFEPDKFSDSYLLFNGRGYQESLRIGRELQNNTLHGITCCAGDP